MKPQLLKILTQEASIFSRFNASQTTGNALVACASPNSNLIPHWNVVYPHADGSTYKREDLTGIQNFFEGHGVTGHVMLHDEKWRADAVEIVEYFYRNPSTTLDVIVPPQGFSLLSDNDLDGSSPIINASFEMDAATGDYFKRQLQKLSESSPSHFWLYGVDGIPCAAISSFTTPDDVDFLFNASVLPDWRGQRISTAMFHDFLHRTNRTVYTYSDNPIVRGHLMPGLGFVSAGEVFVVSLEVYLRKVLS